MKFTTRKTSILTHGSFGIFFTGRTLAMNGIIVRRHRAVYAATARRFGVFCFFNIGSFSSPFLRAKAATAFSVS